MTTSSLWNFCIHFSDVNLAGNQWWRRMMPAVSQATMTAKDFYTGSRAQQPLQSINETFKKVSYMCAKRVKMISSDTKDKCQKPEISNIAFIQLLLPTSHALLTITLGTKGFLACGGNFQCWLNADTSLDWETGNRARKVSGTQGKFTSKGKLKRGEVWCYTTMVTKIII